MKNNMKTIELNEQQIEFIKEQLESISNNYDYRYSQKYQAIAQQIITKLEE